MKPQDLLVALKLWVGRDQAWTYPLLARSLGMRVSEAHGAVRRAVAAGLLPAEGLGVRPRVESLREFLVHGAKYSFPALRGELARGIPTAHAASPLKVLLANASEPPQAWPHPKGTARGPSLAPLVPSAPGAALEDPALYELLALFDALRAGRAREREIATRLLEERLTERGFRHDQSAGAPICRWTFGETLLDAMPIDPSVLGFARRWHPGALRTRRTVPLPSGVEIAVVSPPGFLATELDAFPGRGWGNYASSHDLEDFVSVVDGRDGIVEEVSASSDDLRSFLGIELGKPLTDERFLSAFPGHLPPHGGSQTRAPILLQRLRALAGTDLSTRSVREEQTGAGT